jgi:hypothetical protein
MMFQLSKPKLAYFVGIALFLGLTALVSASHVGQNRLESASLIEQKAGQKLDRERWALIEHAALKRATIEALSAGQMTLKDATAICLEIDVNWPRVIANIRSNFNGNSDSEREARCLAEIACNRPYAAEIRMLLVSRLDAEFKSLFPAASRLTLCDQITSSSNSDQLTALSPTAQPLP